MRIAREPRFQKNFSELPRSLQKKLAKQLSYLLVNLRLPSLRAKKFDESQGIWQARVDNHYRFYFIIDRDTYVLLSVLPHKD